MGKIVLGTVAGDIHDIGKTMVATLLTADGFDVIDLGVDIPADTFVEAIKQYKPNILAMSALMTTTSAEQKKTIETLQSQGLREGLKILVGGGAITKEFAMSIGADGYGSTAVAAPKVARQLLGR